jgi:hypothetical protein
MSGLTKTNYQERVERVEELLGKKLADMTPAELTYYRLNRGGRSVIRLDGQTYGRLRVVAPAEEKGYWHCICSCGAPTKVLGTALRRGATRSCGCLRREIKGRPRKDSYKPKLEPTIDLYEFLSQCRDAVELIELFLKSKGVFFDSTGAYTVPPHLVSKTATRPFRSHSMRSRAHGILHAAYKLTNLAVQMDPDDQTPYHIRRKELKLAVIEDGDLGDEVE